MYILIILLLIFLVVRYVRKLRKHNPYQLAILGFIIGVGGLAVAIFAKPFLIFAPFILFVSTILVVFSFIMIPIIHIVKSFFD